MAIADELELAFRQSWFLLYAQGVGEGYLQSLRKFVQAAVTAYQTGYTLTTLNLELIAHQKSTGDQDLDEILRLDDQEVQIRTIWLTLIYMALDQVAGKITPPSGGNEELVQLVEGVILAKRQGYTLETLKLEMVLQATTTRSPEQASILSQWMRIVFMTLEATGNTAA